MMSCACSCSCGPLIVPKSSVGRGSSRARRNAVGVISPHGSTGRGERSGFVGVRASMVDSYENSSDFAKRMEQAWLISQVRVSSSLETTCSAKSLQETQAASYVVERVQRAAQTVRGQGFEPSGWDSLPL
ncbi:hypothetical protein EUGRSUZ_C04033 [Eucalyptus grandis]|uniref:Uncharacterized protein n=2 Tax=Eucalyptus grandis TaxID=71139 RepID=A0ACC3LMU0_EUCGR|nr:hypothetical protein EUGRSUZ_C04033 [Eucalyptus grandis]